MTDTLSPEDGMTERLDQMGETKRMANAMQKWTREEWIDWYRAERLRIMRMANTARPSVRRTLEWSMPFLDGVISGEIEPVLPPPPPPRMTRMMHAIKTEPTRPKLRLNAKKKAGVTNRAMA